jgi:hypothetical protein
VRSHVGKCVIEVWRTIGVVDGSRRFIVDIVGTVAEVVLVRRRRRVGVVAVAFFVLVEQNGHVRIHRDAAEDVGMRNNARDAGGIGDDVNNWSPSNVFEYPGWHVSGWGFTSNGVREVEDGAMRFTHRGRHTKTVIAHELASQSITVGRGAWMQWRRLDTTTDSSAEADGPRLQLGVAGVGRGEDGVAEPGGAGLVESLLRVDQERVDRVPVGVVRINGAQKLRLINQTLESRRWSMCRTNVRRLHALPLKFRHDFGSTHRAVVSRVFAVAHSAAPSVSVPT